MLESVSRSPASNVEEDAEKALRAVQEASLRQQAFQRFDAMLKRQDTSLDDVSSDLVK